MADEDDYMQGDVDMGDSDDDLDEDDGDDEGMNEEEAPSQPEPVEEDGAIARRRAIQAIMRDNSISDQEKRMRIQSLMSGGRTEVAPPPTPVLPAPEGNNACVHYERNCNIVAPCCNRVFGCRICHDELSPAGHPQMNRFLVREVVCKLCSTRQAASYVSPEFNTFQLVHYLIFASLLKYQQSMYKLSHHFWRVSLQSV